MAEKKKFQTFTSPEGEAIWPALNTPDTYSNDDGSTKTEYKTGLRIPEEVFVSSGFKEFLDAEVEKALDLAVDNKTKQPLSPAARAKAEKKGAQYPYKIPVDKEGKDIEGVIDVSFKIAAGGIDKKTKQRYDNKPVQFDSSLPKPKVIDVFIRGGSTIKVSFTLFHWATAALGYGVSLRPRAVQVIKLSERAGEDADRYGFAGSEDGFAYDGHGEFDGASTENDDASGDETDEDIPF